MKKILSILTILALCLSTRAQLITATLTITNTPSTGNSLTVKSSTFYWTNGTPIGNFMVLITNTPGNDATNLYTVTSAALPLSGVQVQNPSSNVVTFAGINLSASISGSGWAGLVLTTNGNNPATQIVAPANIYPAAMRTNAWSQLVSDININSTNAIDQNSTTASQLVGLTNTQTITGTKTFSQLNVLGQTVLNASNSTPANLIPVVIPCGSNYYTFMVTNAATGNFVAVTTNGELYASTIVGFANGAPRDQFGVSASAAATSTALGSLSFAGSMNGLAVGVQAFCTNINATAIGAGSTASGFSSIALGPGAVATNQFSLAVGDSAVSTNVASVAIGTLSTTTSDHQIMVGTSSEFAQFPGGVLFTGPETNLTTAGTTTLGGILTVPAFINSSLANSNNADLNISTNSYVQLSGPSGSFYIAGIAGGVAGRIVTIQNSSGQLMVIGNQSGVDSTAANRINTLTGADLNPVNIATLWYDGSASRWVVVSSR